MQPEHQEHLRRPAADALDLRELGDDRFVVQRLDVVEIEQVLLDVPREIAQIADLLTTVAGATQLLVGHRGEAVGGWGAAGHQLGQAAVDRRRRFGRQLLIGDGAGQRREVVVPLCRGQAARAVRLDQAGDDRVAAQQHPASLGVVVRSHAADDTRRPGERVVSARGFGEPKRWSWKPGGGRTTGGSSHARTKRLIDKAQKWGNPAGPDSPEAVTSALLDRALRLIVAA